MYVFNVFKGLVLRQHLNTSTIISYIHIVININEVSGTLVI